MDEKEIRERARKHVEELKEFYSHVSIYIVINIMLNILNWLTSPEYWWAKWPMLGWGIGLAIHGASIFGIDHFLGKDWEERKINEIVRKEKEKQRQSNNFS